MFVLPSLCSYDPARLTCIIGHLSDSLSFQKETAFALQSDSYAAGVFLLPCLAHLPIEFILRPEHIGDDKLETHGHNIAAVLADEVPKRVRIDDRTDLDNIGRWRVSDI